MGVDGNFERLEDEVNRLLQVLEEQRRENEALRQQVEDLQSQGRKLQAESERYNRLEGEYKKAMDDRQGVKERLERILARLQEIPL